MTTIAVQRTDENILLCADQRATPVDNMRLDAVSKIIEMSTGEYVAVAGALAAMQAFELFAADNEVDFSSTLTIYRTIMNFRQDLHVNQLCLTDKHTDAGDFAVFPLQLLIVNNDGLMFSVMNYGEVIDHPKHFALGSGAPYALGALFSDVGIHRAMAVAAHFDPATSPTYDTIEIEIPKLGPGETTYYAADEDAAE